MAQTPLLDLFSGIGGFSVALRDVCDTVAYCEIDAGCRAVLEARMRDGAIGRAPVFEDVRRFHGSDIPRLDRPLLLCAGFPCQDVSAGGAGAGIRGDRSSLFFEVPRLIDELGERVGAVLLENSPCIRARGLREVLEALESRGFECRWGVFSPGELGSPQLRWRWILYGARPGFEMALPAPAGAWPEEPPVAARYVATPGRPREDLKRPGPEVQRCRMLGNSVCPPVIAHALRCLAGDGGAWSTASPARLNLPDKEVVLRCPATGGSVRSTRYWSTPAYNAFVWSIHARQLWRGRRSVRNIANQLAYDGATLALMRQRHGGDWHPKHTPEHYRINPGWIEWLMGFREGHTQGVAPLEPGIRALP